MTDRNVQYPNRFHVKPVPGTDDICEIIPAPGTVYEDGTFWNKANVLQDAVAALYGKDTAATPNDIFAAIRPLIAEAKNAVRLASGTYVGNGEGTKTLLFEFKPEIVFISSLSTSPKYPYLMVFERFSPICALLIANGNGVGSVFYFLTWGENSISITRDNENQFPYHNASGQTYYYHAIG